MKESILLDQGMIICQFCMKQTSDEYNFCIECDKQIKCLECHSKILPNKNYCLKCNKDLAPVRNNEQAPNHYVRTVEKDGDSYKERTEFRLTDMAVGVIAPIVLPATIPGFNNISKKDFALNSDPNEQNFDFELVEREIKNSETESELVPAAKLSPNVKTSSLNKYFKEDGDTLVSKIIDFKGKNWADQQRNFLILYTKAYKEVTGKAVADKEHYKAAAARNNIVDPNNFSNILTRLTKAKFIQLGEGFELNDEGEKDAIKIISMIENDNEKPGYVYTNRAPNSHIKTHKLSQEDKSNIENWSREDVELRSLDIRNVKTGRNAALLGLWIVTIYLKKVNALMWNEVMHYLSKKYVTLSVKPEALSKAMASKDNDKYFQKNPDGAYFLSQAGQKVVEEWISGTLNINKDVK